MADIFQQIASLFRNQTPEGEVPVFSLHRFFASDPNFAPVADELSRIYDDKMVVEIWRGALPNTSRSPYFKWTGPKKLVPDDLVRKMADVENLSYSEAEEMMALMYEIDSSVVEKGCEYYGVELFTRKKK